MLNEKEQKPPLPYRVTKLLCHRTARFFTPEQHARCPYCFGGEEGARTGMHHKFCDFVRGRDPVQFGFPTSCERDEQG